ncbi:MAG: phosphatase PAP2 family protein [Lachnospiraceae bacterium]|nr:phosphatase PAP2 family protein [Lachnospiraceae bacterium]
MAWEFDVLYFFQSLHNPVGDAIWPLISLLGDKGLFCALTSVLILIFVKDKRVGLTMIGAWILDVLICNVCLKPLVMRDRPCWIDPTVQLLVETPDDYSFPSGHSGIMFSWAVSIFMYHKRFGIAAIALGVLVMLSRLYLFVHFPTDVLVGALCGTIAAIISYFIVKRFWPDIEKRLNARKQA